MSVLPLVIGLGELLWDLFPDKALPGGAPANFAFHANQLGCHGMVASRVGRDSLGNDLTDYLKRQGLDVSLLQVVETHPTGSVTVEFTAPGQPQYTIHTDVAWDFLEATAELMATARKASVICFGTLAQRSPVSRESIQSIVQATDANCLRVYDVNLRQQFYERDWIERSLQLANIVKLNHEEAAVLGTLLGWGQLSLKEFATRLRGCYELSHVCVTRGAEGCLVHGPEGTVDIPGEPVHAIDTVGAGDAFTAGLITALLAGLPSERAAKFANRIGGLVATKQGGMPSLRAEFALLRENW